MNIKRLVVGYLQANCYLIIKDNNCLVIDPGADYNKIKEVIGDMNVLGIMVTHYHPDHIGALAMLQNDTKAPIYDNNSSLGIHHIGPFSFETIEVKGHSDDSVVFYFETEHIMFTGDFLFKETIGRTDLPSGSLIKMNDSLKKIKHYPGSTIIYPGHGSDSSLDYEFSNNQFLMSI